MTDDTLDNAYQTCLQIAQQHYENFPTASWLLARSHRRATAAIYAFARSADDIADEGTMTAAIRHAQLDAMSTRLSQIEHGIIPDEPVFMALSDTIQRYRLPITPFEKLLQAFRTDIDTHRFNTYVELANYCDHSANPVGELVLRLHNNWNDETSEYSNRICTALQLINFIQDLDSDYHQRGRIYIPMDEMRRFAVDESGFAKRQVSSQLIGLVQFQLDRARELLLSGLPLLTYNHGRLRFILKFTVFSALRMCNKLQARSSVFARPTLHAGDITRIAIRSLLFQPTKAAC